MTTRPRPLIPSRERYRWRRRWTARPTLRPAEDPAYRATASWRPDQIMRAAPADPYVVGDLADARRAASQDPAAAPVRERPSDRHAGLVIDRRAVRAVTTRHPPPRTIRRRVIALKIIRNTRAGVTCAFTARAVCHRTISWSQHLPQELPWRRRPEATATGKLTVLGLRLPDSVARPAPTAVPQ